MRWTNLSRPKFSWDNQFTDMLTCVWVQEQSRKSPTAWEYWIPWEKVRPAMTAWCFVWTEPDSNCRQPKPRTWDNPQNMRRTRSLCCSASRQRRSSGCRDSSRKQPDSWSNTGSTYDLQPRSDLRRTYFISPTFFSLYLLACSSLSSNCSKKPTQAFLHAKAIVQRISTDVKMNQRSTSCVLFALHVMRTQPFLRFYFWLCASWK